MKSCWALEGYTNPLMETWQLIWICLKESCADSWSNGKGKWKVHVSANRTWLLYPDTLVVLRAFLPQRD